jgi:hypothetical protein
MPATECGPGAGSLAADEAMPGLTVVAQEIPVAVLGIGRFDALGQHRHGRGRAGGVVVEEILVETPAHRHAHGQGDDDAQREQRDKQLGGDTKRRAHQSIRTTQRQDSMGVCAARSGKARPTQPDVTGIGGRGPRHGGSPEHNNRPAPESE